jgi:hypothetical protein
MYQDDDPYLADVRKVFLDFPEAVEVEAWGRPTFRARKKIFGVFSGTDERPWGLIFKPDSDERAPLLADERFYSPPYFGRAAGSPSISRPARSTGMRSASSPMPRTARLPCNACSEPWTCEPAAGAAVARSVSVADVRFPGLV